LVFPVAGPTRTGGARTPFRASVHASREVDQTTGLCMSVRYAGCWVTCNTRPGSVSISHRGSVDRPSSDSLESGSFPRAVSPLRSFFASPRGSSFQSRLSCQGFVPLRDVTRRCPLGAGALRLPLSSVLRFSQPLDGLRHLPACGLIASHSHVQGLPFRGFSRPTAVLARRQAMPPCRYHSSARRHAGCHIRMDRLRGFDPWSEAFLEVGV